MLDKSASNLSQLNKSYGRSSTNSLGGQSIFASLDGTRSTKSTMGTQYNSHKASAPSFSFGSGPARIQFTGAAARGTRQACNAALAPPDLHANARLAPPAIAETGDLVSQLERALYCGKLCAYAHSLPQ